MARKVQIPILRKLVRLAIIAGMGLGIYALLWRSSAAHEQSAPPTLAWIEAGQDGTLPAEMDFSNAHGKVGILNTAGPVEMKGHPFFEPLGLNPRGCVTCHQPADAMSVSVASLRERWRVTKGEDPVFAAVDGSNNPKLPQALESSHSLLLKRGVFRVGLSWPPRDRNGKAIQPEFTIAVVRDPTGVNLDETYGLTGVNPTVSVFRRPRPAANLKYTQFEGFLNLMADARHLTLKQQAFGAYKDHQEGRQGQLVPEEMEKILAFENQVYAAQSFDPWGGSLVESNGAIGLGPRALAEGKMQFRADNDTALVFRWFDAWKQSAALPPALPAAQRAFRASVARGSELFLTRQFARRDGRGNSLTGSCATCHHTPMIGQSFAPRWVDVGRTNAPTWTEPAVSSEQAELPVFKCTCNNSAPPHPYLGRVIYTTDPGRALITGKCADIGSLVIGQLRGLAARAPYFSNGAAQNLRDVMEFYDRRFEMKLSELEKEDLVNFLRVL